MAKAKSPEEWVETLVQQMASARDMADARSRAASILQTFQQAVLHTSGPQASTKLLRTHAVHTIRPTVHTEPHTVVEMASEA